MGASGLTSLVLVAIMTFRFTLGQKDWLQVFVCSVRYDPHALQFSDQS